MNLIDNGIKEIESIERVITETELYFLVTFTDMYGRKGRQKKLPNIKNIENYTWVE
jgi:hypothetical protein